MPDAVSQSDLHLVAATAIVYNDEGKFLILKRSPDKKVFPSRWTVPGGGLEPSDYISKSKHTEDAWYFVVEDVIRREVNEEAGIEIEKPQYLFDLIFIRPDNVPVLVLSYMAKYKSGEVVLEEGDATEYRWITAQEARDFDLISGIAQEIEYADELIKGNTNAQLIL